MRKPPNEAAAATVQVASGAKLSGMGTDVSFYTAPPVSAIELAAALVGCRHRLTPVRSRLVVGLAGLGGQL